jgi:hypothetical protein
MRNANPHDQKVRRRTKPRRQKTSRKREWSNLQHWTKRDTELAHRSFRNKEKRALNGPKRDASERHNSDGQINAQTETKKRINWTTAQQTLNQPTENNPNTKTYPALTRNGTANKKSRATTRNPTATRTARPT